MGNNKKNVMVKLTAFEDSKREDPIYRSKAYSTEKEKGNQMIQYLKNLFGIGLNEEKEYFKKEVEEQRKMIFDKRFGSNKISWTRDDDGKIISPFSKKSKEIKEK